MTQCKIIKKYLLNQYITELNYWYDCIYKKLSLENYKVKNEKIKEAVERRCQDLAYNQRRMIDNITDKEIRKIYIDRLIVENDENEEILITDMDKIKDATIDHFRNFAGSKNRDRDIPVEWINDYKPIDSIQESLYDNVLNPITDEEWEGVIKELPPNKASRPTNIAYEDIKHSPLEFNNTLKELINDIFNQQQIPQDWKDANIYPIPKPKPWGYKLVNTRPITLLEVPRKVMMKILTKRLSKILSENKVLQGYQYAGLPFKSTFEPLRIINEIIQHSNERDKEL